MGIAFWKKQPKERIEYSPQLTKRVSKIPTVDLTMWIEQAMNETSRVTGLYISSGELLYLEDMLNGAEAIHYLVQELRKRTVL